MTIELNNIDRTTQIVAAYVGANATSADRLPALLQAVYSTLQGLGQPAEPPAVQLQPAVPARKSIAPDYLICLEDGKKFKSLKRHLRTSFGLTPEQYREKWSLPADYPMVAPNYSATRSQLAKDNGLGRKPELLAA